MTIRTWTDGFIAFYRNSHVRKDLFRHLVQIYETATKKKVSTLLINNQPRHIHERGYECSYVITFSSDDNYNYVAAGSSDGVRTWEWRKSDGTPKTFNAADGVHVVEFDKSGKFLVTGSSYNGGLKTFLMPAKEGQKSLETAFANSRNTLALQSYRNKWRAASGGSRARL